MARSGVYETLQRPSVCLSVRSINWPYAAAGLLPDIDRLQHGRRSEETASSATLSADVGRSTQTCSVEVIHPETQKFNFFR